MAKKFGALVVTCPHCYAKQVVYPDDYNLLCGDGDCGDIKSEGSCDFVVDSCDKCGEDIHVTVWIPPYVEAELQDTFDCKTWLDSRGLANNDKIEYGKILPLMIKAKSELAAWEAVKKVKNVYWNASKWKPLPKIEFELLWKHIGKIEAK
jgi:hypothetical protein